MADKLDRADKHLGDLKRRLHAFNREYSNSVVFEDDPHTGDRTYKIASIPPFDKDIPLIAGDAVHNIRTALDHLACRLVFVGTSGQGPFDDVYFPIGDTPKQYKSILRGVVKRLTPEAILAINTVEPYKGGRGHDVWRLHRLDIVDKHRLPLGVEPTNSLQSMAPSERANLARYFLSVRTIPSGSVMLTAPPIAHFPLQAGHELCTVPHADVEQDMHFHFDIALNEPGIVQGESLLETLKGMLDLVRNVVADFAPLL